MLHYIAALGVTVSIFLKFASLNLVFGKLKHLFDFWWVSSSVGYRSLTRFQGWLPNKTLIEIELNNQPVCQ